MIVAIIAIIGLIIAIVALSALFIVISEYHHSPASPSTPTPSPQTTPYPTTTPQPTIVPTATPNLSSAKPDPDNQRISINITAVNTAPFAAYGQYMPIYPVNITNNGASSIAVVSIIATTNNGEYNIVTNFTYWGGNQIIAPHSTEQFSNGASNTNGLGMSEIYVYYEVSGQLYHNSFSSAPLPYFDSNQG